MINFAEASPPKRTEAAVLSAFLFHHAAACCAMRMCKNEMVVNGRVLAGHIPYNEIVTLAT